jgi:cardiolipin synthase
MIVILGISLLYLSWKGSWIYTLILSSIALWMSLLIIFEKREPIKKVYWLALLILYPLLAIIFYFLFGRKFKISKWITRRKGYRSKVSSSIDKVLLDDVMKEAKKEHIRFTNLAFNIGNTPISFQTNSTILKNGEETYREIFKQIEQAKSHIYLEFYIVRSDRIGNKLKDLLIRKAKEGVQVKFIIDGVGSVLLSRSYLKELRKHGVKIEYFFPLLSSFLQGTLNFRDHRKIVIVDRKVGFIGGINIGDEYLGQSKFQHWRDTNIKIEFEAVEYLENIFLNNWRFLTNENVEIEKDNKIIFTEHIKQNNKGYVHIVSSGPHHERELIKNLFFSMITSATESICISSPYFIPDKDILNALKIASQSGVSVKIILPSSPDHQLTFWASRSYFMELMSAGVEIYLYRKGFIHSKFVIVDKELASIGSANMDMRSFLINFEVNAFLYKTESISTLVQDFKNDLLDSSRVKRNRFRKRSYKHRFYEACSRLFGPFL